MRSPSHDVTVGDNPPLMDVPQPETVETETISFTPTKFQRDELLSIAKTTADLNGVGIVSIEEERGLLWVDIRMKVSGNRDSIVGFAEGTGGIREHEPLTKKIRRWLGAAIQGMP
jgi:hypothetical protein